MARLGGQARWRGGQAARLQAGPALSWARVPCSWLGGSGPGSLLLLLLPAPHTAPTHWVQTFSGLGLLDSHENTKVL